MTLLKQQLTSRPLLTSYSQEASIGLSQLKMALVQCVNLTSDDPKETNLTNPELLEAQRLADAVGYIIGGWAQPGVCLFGIVGNILNLTILTRRKLQKSFRTLEQAANLCLICLAVSDLMFCILAFLTTFIPHDNVYNTRGAAFLFGMYGTAVINIFIMESTMLTVAMSLERFLAICFPLRQDLYLTTRRIKYVIVGTFIFSLAFNIPVFWRFEAMPLCSHSDETISQMAHSQIRSFSRGVHSNTQTTMHNHSQLSGKALNSNVSSYERSLTSPNGLHASTQMPNSHTTPLPLQKLPSSFSSISPFQRSSFTTDDENTSKSSISQYKIRQVLLGGSQTNDMTYRISWAIVGNFIPLILLFYFNVCLCQKIYQSYKIRHQLKRQSKTSKSSHIVTLTLVVIVVMFFILVAPSEIMLLMERNTATSRTVETILNFMQSLNFSVNFILYCIISPHFRKTLKHLLLCGCYNVYQLPRESTKDCETTLM